MAAHTVRPGQDGPRLCDSASDPIRINVAQRSTADPNTRTLSPKLQLEPAMVCCVKDRQVHCAAIAGETTLASAHTCCNLRPVPSAAARIVNSCLECRIPWVLITFGPVAA
jgi:hypothetical protein